MVRLHFLLRSEYKKKINKNEIRIFLNEMIFNILVYVNFRQIQNICVYKMLLHSQILDIYKSCMIRTLSTDNEAGGQT